MRRGQDYEIDHISGVFRIKRDLLAGTELQISYRFFPFNLRKSYLHRRLVMAPTEEVLPDSGRSPPHPTPVQASTDSPGTNLRRSGSIIRGVSVGSSQGLQVDSGLRLQVAGKLTENVEVLASLTDQNTPIQPEGNTQTLQEIDKVFVQITAPRLRATLGDFSLDLVGTSLTNYSRKLEGVMAEGSFDGGEFKVSAAVSRGQFTTNQFAGQEGNQGPYQLRAETGNINIIVLAGTEKVWLDGELLARGENNDYVIEYGNGQITFTRNRLITADSRIVVDFQSSEESFQRNYLAAQGRARLLNEKLEVTTTFVQESDDKDSPLTVPLSDEALAVLQAAGDSLAIVPGDTLVGPGRGNYTKDSTGVFIYVGDESGEYNVRFSFFGAGLGGYRNIGLGRFEYVGDGNGDYRPFILLPKAAQQQVFGVRLSSEPFSRLKLDGEVAINRFDSNLYSDKNDSENTGNAYAVGVSLQPTGLRISGKDFGQLQLSGRLRRKSSNYRDIDRTNVAEFNRVWNLDDGNLPATENIADVQAQYRPWQGVSVRGGLGRLDRSSDLRSNRWEAQAQVKRTHLPELDYFVESIDRDEQANKSTSNWLRQRGHVRAGLWRFTPTFEYEGEVRKDSQADSNRVGFRFDAYTAGLQFAPWKSLVAGASYKLRDDDDRQGGTFLPKSRARTQALSLLLKNWHAINLTASYTHRNREFSDPTAQDTRTDLADLRLAYHPKNRGVRGSIFYQISNTQMARQEEVFVEVDEGDGNFRFNDELNEFEPDPFGRFVRRLFTTKDFVPVVQLRLRGDLRLNGKQFFNKGKPSRSHRPGRAERLLSPFSSETFFRLDERSTEEDVNRIYLLDSGVFQNDSTTIFGSTEFRQDVHLWQNSRKFSVRYRFRGRSELNNQFVGGGQKRVVSEHQIRVIRKLWGQVNTQILLSRNQEERVFKSPAREDRDVRKNRAEVDLVFRPRRKWELALKTVANLSKDVLSEPETRATLVSLAPRVNYSLSSKGRVRAEIDWTRVALAPKGRLIPFELTDGSRSGTTFRWNLGLDYRVSQNVQASVSYFGRSEPDRPQTQHIAKVEMRAFF